MPQKDKIYLSVGGYISLFFYYKFGNIIFLFILYHYVGCIKKVNLFCKIVAKKFGIVIYYTYICINKNIKTMTQKEKDLLIRDLCARLPYGVKFVIDNGQNNVRTLNGIRETIPYEDWQMCAFARGISAIPIEDIKPYLFPMSSMTKAQKKKYYSLADDVTIKPGQGSLFGIKIHCIKLGISDNPHEGLWDNVDVDALDWLHKNHFDYRGLIEKGLAIDATNLNIY